jgi:hypothetical protein
VDGREMARCFYCPSTIKKSGRKFNVGTFEDGKRGMIMTCKITGITDNAPRQLSSDKLGAVVGKEDHHGA